MDELAKLRQAVAKRDEWTQRVDDGVVAAYEAGFSLSQIAEALGLRTLEAARQRLLARGVELRPQGRAPKA